MLFPPWSILVQLVCESYEDCVGIVCITGKGKGFVILHKQNLQIA